MIDRLARKYAHTRVMKTLGIASGPDFWRVFWQFFKFGLIGVSNTLLSLVLYYMFKWLGAHYLVANVLGMALGVLNSFFWNSQFVFKKGPGSGRGTFLRMCLVYGATTVLSTALLYVWVHLLGISDNLAPIINLCITVPLNFVLNKLWVFKDR